MSNSIKLGDKVAVYCASYNLYGAKGIVIEVRKRELLVEELESEDPDRWIVHPKQCRKLKSKTDAI